MLAVNKSYNWKFSLFPLKLYHILVLFVGLNDWNLKKEEILAIQQFIYLTNTMWKNDTATTAWHRFLMLAISLVIYCYGLASHSSTIICFKLASVVVFDTLQQTAHLSWSHKCSVGLRSGLQTGHSILSASKLIPKALNQGSNQYSLVFFSSTLWPCDPTGRIWIHHWT